MIGLFSSYSKAEQVAVRYLREVPGFRDYDVTYQIREKRVIGDADGSSSLYLICGWDLDEALDEVDIVESDCYVLREDAEAAHLDKGEDDELAEGRPEARRVLHREPGHADRRRGGEEGIHERCRPGTAAREGKHEQGGPQKNEPEKEQEEDPRALVAVREELWQADLQ